VKEDSKAATAKSFDTIIAAKDNGITFGLSEKENEKNTDTEDIGLEEAFVSQKTKDLRKASTSQKAGNSPKASSGHIPQTPHHKTSSSNHHKPLPNDPSRTGTPTQKKSKVSIRDEKKPRLSTVPQIFDSDSDEALVHIPEAPVLSRTNSSGTLQVPSLNNSQSRSSNNNSQQTQASLSSRPKSRSQSNNVFTRSVDSPRGGLSQFAPSKSAPVPQVSVTEIEVMEKLNIVVRRWYLSTLSNSFVDEPIRHVFPGLSHKDPIYKDAARSRSRRGRRKAKSCVVVRSRPAPNRRTKPTVSHHTCLCEHLLNCTGTDHDSSRSAKKRKVMTPIAKSSQKGKSQTRTEENVWEIVNTKGSTYNVSTDRVILC